MIKLIAQLAQNSTHSKNQRIIAKAPHITVIFHPKNISHCCCHKFCKWLRFMKSKFNTNKVQMYLDMVSTTRFISMYTDLHMLVGSFILKWNYGPMNSRAYCNQNYFIIGAHSAFYTWLKRVQTCCCPCLNLLEILKLSAIVERLKG